MIFRTRDTIFIFHRAARRYPHRTLINEPIIRSAFQEALENETSMMSILKLNSRVMTLRSIYPTKTPLEEL